MNMPTPLTLRFSEVQDQMSDLVAKYRKESHDGNREEKADLGKYGLAADKYGCLWEIGLAQALNEQGVPTPGVVLFTPQSPKGGGDLKIGPFKYSLKTSPPDRWRVCVNMEQYRKRAFHADYLICAFYTSPTTVQITKPIPYAEVAGWSKDEKARDPFYFKARKDFDLLVDWSELPGVSGLLKPSTLSN